MTKSRADSQLNLPPSLLPNSEQQPAVLSKKEQQAEVALRQADADSSVLFDTVLTQAGISSQEASGYFGCSESLVRKMRSPNYRERVSLAQLLLLPVHFHFQLHRELNRRHDFSRQALRDVLDAVGTLALAARR